MLFVIAIAYIHCTSSCSNYNCAVLQVFRILGFGLVWQTSGLQMIRIASVCVIWQSCCCENVDVVYFFGCEFLES